MAIEAVLPPLRDRIRPGVRVLFVGINPGIRSSLTGHHFAGFSNRFWKLLYDSSLVPEPISYANDVRLPEWGYGITNIVPRPTPGIDTLRPEEYAAGRIRLRRKVLRYRPPVVALVGVTVFRALYPQRKGSMALGLQPERIGDSALFVLPNPSGRNANYSYAEMLAAFRSLREFVGRSSGPQETFSKIPLRRSRNPESTGKRGGDETVTLQRPAEQVEPERVSLVRRQNRYKRPARRDRAAGTPSRHRGEA